MRLFVASSFGPAFSARLKEISAYARDKAGRDSVKWVEPGRFHLTYAFLGETDKAGAEAAGAAIEAALAEVKAFRVASGGLGAFPSSRRPAVLWVGFSEGAELLRELAGRLAEGLKASGLNFEDRFEPHVTIGRVKRELPEDFFRRTADFSAAARAISEIASVELMESVLTREGPVYRPVRSKRLL